MKYSDFIYRLNSYLDEHNYSQAYLARNINYSKVHISNILSGKRNPSTRFIKALAAFTNLSEDFWLLGQAQSNLNMLNTLVDSLIQNKSIHRDGSYSKDIENLLLSTLKIEIRLKLKSNDDNN